MEKVESPCNGVCIIDEDTNLCVGCLRTANEISKWEQYSEIEKKEVLKNLVLRKKETDE